MVDKKLNTSKIVVLGEGKYNSIYFSWTLILARVGKTSLTIRYCNNNFDDKQASTLDASCLEKTIDIHGG